jgi:hypothetical protein
MNKIRLNKSKIIALFSVFFTTLIVFWLVLFHFPIRFEENDDILMLLLSNGQYTGQYESNLVFIHMFYGKLLNFLYSKKYNIEWYTLLFFIFHFLSMTVILYRITVFKLVTYIKISLFFFICIVYLNFLIYLQFTTTAFSLAIAGVLILDFNNKITILISALLLLISSFIRFDVAILVYTIMSFSYFLTSRKNICKRNIFYILMFFIVLVFINKIPSLFLDNEWHNYYSTIKLTTKVWDNLLADGTKSIYQGVCSEADYNLLKFFYLDKDVFTFLIFFSFIYYRELNEKFKDNSINRQFIYPQSKLEIDKLFFDDNSYLLPITSDFKPQLENPFKITSNFRNCHFYYLGWISSSPHNMKLDKINKNKNAYIYLNCADKKSKFINAIMNKNKNLNIYSRFHTCNQ